MWYNEYMGWRDGKYYYSSGVLKAIAANYATIYEGLPVSWRRDEYNLWSLAEFKADFDIALKAIGKGHWTGNISSSKFRDFLRFGRCQQVVIADIFGITDDELLKLGLYNLPQLRGYAYYLMKTCLNGD